MYLFPYHYPGCRIPPSWDQSIACPGGSFQNRDKANSSCAARDPICMQTQRTLSDLTSAANPTRARAIGNLPGSLADAKDIYNPAFPVYQIPVTRSSRPDRNRMQEDHSSRHPMAQLLKSSAFVGLARARRWRRRSRAERCELAELKTALLPFHQPRDVWSSHQASPTSTFRHIAATLACREHHRLRMQRRSGLFWTRQHRRPLHAIERLTLHPDRCRRVACFEATANRNTDGG